MHTIAATETQNLDPLELPEPLKACLGWKLPLNHGRFAELLQWTQKGILSVHPSNNARGDTLYTFERTQA